MKSRFFSYIALVIFTTQVTFATESGKYNLIDRKQHRNYKEKPLKVCVDENFWFPYTFMYKEKLVGFHIDIMNDVLSSLQINVKYYFNPWDKCLKLVESGDLDALLAVSYDQNKKSYLHYPSDAAREVVSDWRISQVIYSLVEPIGNIKKNKKVNLNKLPKPILIEKGYSIKNLIKEKNNIEYFNNTVNIFYKLVNEKKGCTFTTYEVAKELSKNNKFKNKIYINPEPVVSKSYFIAFSKQSDVDFHSRQRIWNSIRAVRSNSEMTRYLLKKYGF